MKLTVQQEGWIRDYEGYRRAGGFYNSADSSWIDFTDIAVPKWYEDYIGEKNKTVASQDVGDWRQEFVEAGKRGGMETRKRGSKYYSDIAKLSWERRRNG